MRNQIFLNGMPSFRPRLLEFCMGRRQRRCASSSLTASSALVWCAVANLFLDCIHGRPRAAGVFMDITTRTQGPWWRMPPLLRVRAWCFFFKLVSIWACSLPSRMLRTPSARVIVWLVLGGHYMPKHVRAYAFHPVPSLPLTSQCMASTMRQQLGDRPSLPSWLKTWAASATSSNPAGFLCLTHAMDIAWLKFW